MFNQRIKDIKKKTFMIYFMKNITKIIKKNVTQEATTTKKIKACFCPVTNYQKNLFMPPLFELQCIFISIK